MRGASLDRLSGGRLLLGVGVGWSREEFDALGVPFARRGARSDEYPRDPRALWHDEVASYAGEFVSFARVRVNPKAAAPGGARHGGWQQRPGAPAPRGARDRTGADIMGPAPP